MRKLLSFLISVLSFSACKKPEPDQFIKIALVNPYWDSIRVTAVSKSRPQSSFYDKWVPGKEKPGREKYLDLILLTGDTADLKILLKPGNKWGRHPLFVTEHHYTDQVEAARSHPAFLHAPQGELIAVYVSDTAGKFVKGTLLYDGKEDSLFSISPQDSLRIGRSVGYFRPEHIEHIKRPFLKLYYGQSPPYTTFISSDPLWETAEKDVTINIP